MNTSTPSPPQIYAREALRDPEKFRILINVCAGSPSNPQWDYYQIGAKLLMIMRAVLTEPLDTHKLDITILKAFDMASKATISIVNRVIGRYESTQRLSEHDINTVLQAVRLLQTMIEDVQRVDLKSLARKGGPRKGAASGAKKSGGRELYSDEITSSQVKEGMEMIYEALFPDSLIQSLIEILAQGAKQQSRQGS